MRSSVVERCPDKTEVGGSIPPASTRLKTLDWLWQAGKTEVEGSIPTEGTKTKIHPMNIVVDFCLGRGNRSPIEIFEREA